MIELNYEIPSTANVWAGECIKQLEIERNTLREDMNKLQMENVRLLSELRGAELFTIGDPERAAFAEARVALGEAKG